MSARALEELLSLFLEREEIAGGAYRVSLALGEHRLGLEVRRHDRRLALRAFPFDAMPAALSRHPAVRERLGTFSDLVESGRLVHEDPSRPYIEVDLGGGEPGRPTYVRALERLAVDCARLRGAAEGLVAAASVMPAPAAAPAAAAAAKAAEPATRPAAPGEAKGPARRRLWESVLEKAIPGGHLPELARGRPVSGGLEGGVAGKAEAPAARKAEAAAPPSIPAPAARAEAKGSPSGQAFAPLAPATELPFEKPAFAEKVRTEKGESGGTKEPGLAVEAPAGAAPEETVAPREPLYFPEPEEIDLASLAAEAPALAAEAPATEVSETCATPITDIPTERDAPARAMLSEAPERDDRTPPSLLDVGPTPLRETSPLAEAREPAETARLDRESDDFSIWLTEITDDGAPPPAAPERASATLPAAGEEAVPERRAAARPEEKEPPLRRAVPRRESFSSSAEVATPAPFSTPAVGPPPAGSLPERQRSLPPLTAPPKRGAEAAATASPPASGQDEAARPAAGGGDDLLSWMDVADTSSPVESDLQTARRRMQLAIPEDLVPGLKTLMREWYRRPDRDVLDGEIRRGSGALWVTTGQEPGETSWRYARPTLRLGRPPVEAGAFTFYHEPQEVTIEQVEAWLVSEETIAESEAVNRHRAAELRQRAWEARAEGDAARAVALFEQVLEIFPEDVQALASLGHIHRKELEDPEKALQFYERALSRAPRFPPALLGRAALEVEKDRHRAAEEAVQALALAPRDPDALELAGIVALRANRRARAREIFLRLYRIDRERGIEALRLLEAERAGEAKWDPRLVIWERDALAAAGPDLDPVTEQLYRERVELADAIDALVRDWAALSAGERRKRIARLSEARSYGLLCDLIEAYGEERDLDVRAAIEEAFAAAPTQGAMAIEDALFGDDFERAATALAIAARVHWSDLFKPALKCFQRAATGRAVKRFADELVVMAGAEATLALLAKLERGFPDCCKAILDILARRPDPACEEAAEALRAVLAVEGGVELKPEDREAIESALEATDRPRKRYTTGERKAQNAD